MNKKLLGIKCDTVEDIMEAVYDKEDYGKFTIFDTKYKDKGPAEFILSFMKDQHTEDELTLELYGPNVIFPPFQKGASEKAGFIGQQTSKYHAESIHTHILMVLGRMMERTNDKWLLFTGLLHDCAKKYDTGVNRNGDLCFYDHEKLSAFGAAIIFKNIGFSKEEAAPYITIIHSHMLPFNVWSKDNSKPWRSEKTGKELEEEFIAKYGQWVHDQVVLLNQCDIGIVNVTIEDFIANHDKIMAKYQDIILRGIDAFKIIAGD